VRINPDDDDLTLLHVLLPPVLPTWTARWALLLRAGQSLLEPRLVTVSGGLQTDSAPHPDRWAAAIESIPPGTCIESGQTPILSEVS